MKRTGLSAKIFIRWRTKAHRARDLVVDEEEKIGTDVRCLTRAGAERNEWRGYKYLYGVQEVRTG